MGTIKIGIIGVGRFGINYLRTCLEIDVSIVKYICSKSKQTINQVLEKVSYNGKTTVNYHEILKDPLIEAVIIATPSSTHYQITKDALLANKHVLVEKPFVFHTSQARELLELAKERNRSLMVGHLHRFNPGIIKMKEDVASGKFGKINYIQSAGTGNGPIRSDMNALWDFFPHDVSILLYLLDEYPIKVRATGGIFHKEGIEDVVSMELWFPNNIISFSMASWIFPLKQRNVTIMGNKCYARFEDYNQNEKLKYYDENPENKERTTKSNHYSSPELIDAKPLTEQLRYFIGAINNINKGEGILSNHNSLTNGFEALKVVTILEAAQKSLKSDGKVIEIKKPTI